MVSIREAESKDIPCLQDLFLQLGYQTVAQSLELHLDQPQNSLSILVAESDNQLCGTVVVHFITPVHENGLWALISALIIDENHRGHGIGQQLLLAAEHIARQKKCCLIELSSNEKRTKAHKFYESNGFKEVRKRFVKHINAQ